MAFTDFLDPVLGPLLQLPSIVAILILSFLISLVITLVYKFATNQSLMKQLKEEIKELQKQVKELRDDPKAAMKVQREMMQVNMKYMGMSMRATLITLIPILFIFGWMSGHFAFDPLAPGQEFTVTMDFNKPVDAEVSVLAPAGVTVQGNAVKQVSGTSVFWTLSGEAGQHQIEYSYGGDTYRSEVLITQGNEYLNPVTKVDLRGSDVASITTNLQKNIVNPFLPFWNGWLATYIFLSIFFSVGLRKLMKVY